MKTWARRIAAVSAILVTVLVAVILIRTAVFTRAQTTVEPIAPLQIGDAAIEHLAAAIRVPTVSVAGTPGADSSALRETS